MLLKMLVGIAAVVVLFVLVVAAQPADFCISRSAAVSAPVEEAFIQVNDFRKWDDWSPFAHIDPEMKKTYDGATAGTGSVYAWSGNYDAGEGSATITESVPNELVRIKLAFERPFNCSNDVEFTFKPEGDHTVVTWSMTGKKNFVAKAMHLFLNMDKMCGDEFAKGLAKLKSIAEAAPAVATRQG